MSLEDKDIDRLKDIFVMRYECDSKMDVVDGKVNGQNTELQLIKQQLNTAIWLAKTTLGSVIGFAVVYIANLILGS